LIGQYVLCMCKVKACIEEVCDSIHVCKIESAINVLCFIVG